MEKTKEQLIEAFKKNNKARREIIAKGKGFANAAEYMVAIYEGKKTIKKSIKASPKKEVKVKPPEDVKETTKELVDYVVAFDTTGSMNVYIDDVKKHVENLIPELFSNDVDLKMRVIAFGDYCDMRGGQFMDAYQQSKFTNDKDKLISFVKGAKKTSGGDSEEFYELVIKKITEETPWREGSKKSVLLIADFDPHKPGYRYGGTTYNIDWREEAKKAAEKNIAFDTLAIHGNRFPWYKELAEITKGVFMPFQSSNKMSEVVAATAYARSGDRMSKAKFATVFARASASGDTELMGTYKSLSKLMEE